MNEIPLHYYFAYGMNTNPDAMQERLEKSGVARSLGAARLYGWKFRFAYHADVIPEPGHAVDGVLWLITDEHLARLDSREGFPHYYNRERMPVEHNGRTYDAHVYYMNFGELYSPPHQSYWDMLEKGYDHFGVHKGQMYRALNECYENMLTQDYDNLDYGIYGTRL